MQFMYVATTGGRSLSTSTRNAVSCKCRDIDTATRIMFINYHVYHITHRPNRRNDD